MYKKYINLANSQHNCHKQKKFSNSCLFIHLRYAKGSFVLMFVFLYFCICNTISRKKIIIYRHCLNTISCHILSLVFFNLYMYIYRLCVNDSPGKMYNIDRSYFLKSEETNV